MSKKEHEEMVKNLPTHEWTNEKQLEYQLQFQKETHQKQLERKSLENVELYTDNVLLKRKVETLETQLESFRKLQSEVHLGIERVWSIDNTLSPSPEDYDLYINHLNRNPFSDDEQNKVSQLNKERSEIIEEIFYKIGNEWIGGDYRAGLQKRTDPERWESLDDMDGSWTEDDIEKGHHLPF